MVEHLNNSRNYNIEQYEEVVISGISGKFPQCDNMREFSEKLFSGEDMVIPNEKRLPLKYFDLPKMGAFKDISKFDAEYFEMTNKHADTTDPLIRILLELTYEAIVDAGVNPEELKGTKTAVIVGAGDKSTANFWDISREITKDEYKYVRYGHARSMYSNRISYNFHLLGPSFSVDTACSSVSFALYNAVHLIRRGECDAAIVGGCNICIEPYNYIQFNQLQMLSPDGQCKVFDATGNGYARSDAVGVIFIQKKSVARRIYCSLAHIGTNCDGYKLEGITFPSRHLQKDLLNKVYSQASVDPSTVEYVEAHGTGTPAGDPEEIHAISEVFCGKNRTNALLVGSVKSNMGHPEAAAGICGIAKALLTIQRGEIPPNLHYHNPNKNIPALFDGRIKVVDKVYPFKGGLIALNSFGFGGTNVHMLLKPNLKRKSKTKVETFPQLVAVSGRTEDGVRNFLKKIEQSEDVELNQLIRATHRQNMKNHFYRGFSLFDTEQPATHISEFSEQKRPVWFIFSGLGTQRSGMGKDLIRFKVFDESLRNTSSILDQFGLNLYELIVNAEHSLGDAISVITGIVAIQIALVDLLRCLNIHPDGILGHSIGEIAASYADGALTAAQAILIAYYRGKCFAEMKIPTGIMASDGLPWSEAEVCCPPGIYPACDNSAENIIISESPGIVNQFLQTLQSERIVAKEVDSVEGANHTKFNAESANILKKYLKNIIPCPKKWSSCWVSTSIPESQWDSDLAQTCSTEYHVNNMISPVYFRNAVTHIPVNAVVIEVGPHCLFQSILKRSLPSTCVNIGLVNKHHHNNTEFFLSSVGRMYTAGLQPKIEALYPEVTFPVSVDTPLISDMVEWNHSKTWTVKHFQETEESLSMYNEMVSLRDEKHKFLKGHTIDGHVLYPAAGYLVLAWKCLAKLNFKRIEEISVKIWNVKIHQATVLLPSSNVIFDVNYLKGTKVFDIRHCGSLIATGKIAIIKEPEMEMLKLPSTPDSSTVTFSGDDLYKELRLCGYEYSGLFQGICSMDCEGTNGTLKWNNNWITFIDTMLQTSIASNMEERLLALPTEIRSVIINPHAHESFKDGDIISVQNNRVLEIIKAGGVEIRKLKTTVTQQKPARGPAPKLEKYLYIPYISKLEVKDNLSYNDSLAVTLQIAIENLTGLHTLNVTEVAGNKSPNEIIMPNIASVLSEETINSPKLTVIVQNTSNFLKTDKTASLEISYLEMESLNPSTIENTDVLVGSCTSSFKVSDNLIFKVFESLKPGAFVILEVSQETKVLDTVNGLFVISSHIVDNKQILLLRKPTYKLWKKIVHYTENNFSWIDNLKEALSESKSTNDIVVVVSSGEKESGIIGLMNCLRLEPGGENLRCIFAPRKKLHESSIEDSFYKDLAKKDLFMNVYINNTWGSYRYIGMNAGTINTEDAYVNTLTPGDLSSLKWIQGPHIQDENLCYVYYASLNFKDCMEATNGMPNDTVPKKIGPLDSVLGFEFCGRNKQGERVMGVTESCALATTVMADPLLRWKVPNHWTMQQAATVPVAYLTVYYALILRGEMKPGQSILIHAGTGGIGIAAITIALSMNVTVYTTVSNKEKREFLKQRFPQLSDRNIANSRDDTFEQHVLQETGGKGVDLVLNSLSEDKLHSSARCLAYGGMFLQIGKNDILQNNSLGMAFFQNSTTFHGVFLDHIISGCSEDKVTLSRIFQEGLDLGLVKPLPAIVYGSHEVEQAFRFLSSDKYIGKVMLKIRNEEPRTIVSSPRKKFIEAIPRAYFREDKVYIVIGGLGGMGLQLADWMITQGAKNLVLTSRTGMKNGYQTLCLSRWKKMGINITLSAVDCSSKNDIIRLIKESRKFSPIGGIFNLAVIINDALFQNQSKTSFVECCVPKANTTKLLDEISRELCPVLDYFVVFSSVSSGRGNPGQTNCGLANSTMERICESRKSEGLPALAIQWGPVEDVGISEKMSENVKIKKLLPQRVSSCLRTLDTFLCHSHPVVSSIVLADKSTIGKVVSNDDSPVEIVADILGINNINDVSPNKTLAQMGADLLMLSEIKQKLEINFNISLGVDDIHNLNFTQIEQLAASDNLKKKASIPESFFKLENRPKHLLPIQVVNDILIKLPSKTTETLSDMNIFIVHPLQGVVSMLKPLAYQLPANMYGLQLTRDTPQSSIECLASHYIKQIKSVQEKGPYLISGYSYGVLIALEIGIQMENAGEEVSLVLLDGALKSIVPFMKYEQKLMEKIQNGNKILLISLLCFIILCGGHDVVKDLDHLLALQTNEQRLSWVVEQIIPVIQCSQDEAKIGIKNITNLLTLADTYSPRSKFTGDVTLVKSTHHSLAETENDPYDLQPVCNKKITVFKLNASHEDIIQNEETVEKIQEIFILVINRIKAA